MKFSSWQLVVILGILIAGIVCAHVFAPGAVAVVVPIATTIFAALFVNKKDPEAEPKDPPSLRMINGGDRK